VSELSTLYQDFSFLLEGNLLKPKEKKDFEQIIDETASKAKYKQSLKKLSKHLHDYYNSPPVILIDEYDAPIHSGYKGYYEEVIDFMRGLLSGAYKDNTYLYRGVITGILRVSKESIFSGVNNLSVFTILSDEFSDKFGFTANEVKQILKDFNLSDKYKGIKQWYNGYKIGDTEEVYNPWSVLNFVSSKKHIFSSYWTQTSANELIRQQIAKQDAKEIRAEILRLINGETIEKSIEENFVFSDLETSKELIWTLLLFSGYLTFVKEIKENSSIYKLKIPNYELKIVFKRTVLEWIETEVRIIKRLLDTTTNHLINNRLEEFEIGFKQIIGDTFSYYDNVKKYEYIYQAYMLGILAIIGDDYIIKSNKESGEGRYDIMLIPHDKSKNGVVMEIKRIRKQQPDESDEDLIKRINRHLDRA
jgi:hypothetical protein